MKVCILSNRHGIHVVLLSVLLLAASCSSSSTHYKSVEEFFASSQKHNVSRYLQLAKSAAIVGGNDAFTGTAIAFTNEALESFIKGYNVTYDTLSAEHNSLLLQLVLYHVLPTPTLPGDIRKATDGYKKPATYISALPMTGGMVKFEAVKTDGGFNLTLAGQHSGKGVVVEWAKIGGKKGDAKQPSAAAYIINHILTCEPLAKQFAALRSAESAATTTSTTITTTGTSSPPVDVPNASKTAGAPNTIQPGTGGKMSTELMLAIAGASILSLVTAIAIITVLVTVSKKAKSKQPPVEVMGNWDPTNPPSHSRSSSPLSSQWSEVDRQEAGADAPVIAESELNWGSDIDQPVPNPLPPGYSGRSYASSIR